MKKFLIMLSVFIIGSLMSLGIVFAMSDTIFPDVNYEDYYGDSLIEMQERGIVSGYANGDFGPNDFVTRAQLVTMLERYDNGLTNENDSIENLRMLLCHSVGVAGKHESEYFYSTTENDDYAAIVNRAFLSECQ